MFISLAKIKNKQQQTAWTFPKVDTYLFLLAVQAGAETMTIKVGAPQNVVISII